MATDSGKLTSLGIKALGTGKHFDGGGLFLDVKPSGAKYWRLKYRHAGREKLQALGVFPEVSLAEARGRRARSRALLRDGIDPMAAKQANALSHKRDAEAAFPLVAAAWLKFKKPGWGTETYRKAEYVTNTYLIPKLKRCSMTSLSTSEAADALLEIAEHAPSLAVKARQYLIDMTNYAIRKRYREEGRILVLRGALPKYKKGHIPAATEPNTVKALVKAIPTYPTFVTRAALQYTMLTALRPGIVASARWSQIDMQLAEWQIPGELMKMKHAHIVPLPRQAMEILLEMQQYTGGKDYVFPPLARQKTPHLNRDTLSKALRELGFRKQHAPHGFRAMLRTVARERLKIDLDTLEAQLAHAKKGEVDKAYDRTQLLDERRQAMQVWADYLDALRDDNEKMIAYLATLFKPALAVPPYAVSAGGTTPEVITASSHQTPNSLPC